MCEWEALAVIVALCKFPIFLLSSDLLLLLTEEQQLMAAFVRKNIHGRLAIWVHFLAEYDFEVQYRTAV